MLRWWWCCWSIVRRFAGSNGAFPGGWLLLTDGWTDERKDGLRTTQVESVMPKRLSYDNEVRSCGLHTRPDHVLRPPTSPATAVVATLSSALCRHCINHVTVTRFSRFLAHFRATISALLTSLGTSYTGGARSVSIIGSPHPPLALS